MNRGNIVFTFVFTLILILPSFILNHFFENFYIYRWRDFQKEIIITFIISFLISFLSKRMKILFGLFFILLTIIQIGFFSYFRGYIMPFHIDLLFTQTQDTLQSAKIITNIIVILTFVSIFLLMFIYLIGKITKPKYNKFALPILMFLLIIFPFIMKNNKQVYVPTALHLPYLNTLFAINLDLINHFSKSNEHYKPYVIKKVDNGKPIVLVIMGESLNFRYMHIFGYKEKNTPLLESLIKDKNFIYKKNISLGVNTTVAVRNFFYVKREPFNNDLIESQKTNLMKIARDNGYNTYWFSMQVPSVINSTILSYANKKKVLKDYHKMDDRLLLKDLKNIDFSKKSFIVLHFRTNHSPYEVTTPKNFWKWNFWKYKGKDFHKYMLNSYMNSILFVDDLIYSTIDILKKTNRPFVFYYVSDHGEMLGSKEENGKYGHTQMDINCAKIPFFYYSNQFHKDFNKSIYNNYLIAKYVAKDLGYKITNPNEKGDLYFIQSPGSSHEIIKYHLNKLTGMDAIK